jgi:hypothetical protein
MDTNMPELMKPREVYRLLRIDPRTLRSMADAGKLTVVKVGKAGTHRRYRASEVRALLAGPGGEDNPEPEPAPVPPGPAPEDTPARSFTFRPAITENHDGVTEN